MLQANNMDQDIKLTSEDIRVLGVLIEKSKTTPDYYPMTVNAITSACNQKSSRKPVVDYSEDIVIHSLNSLKGRSLVSTAVGGTARTTKYKHNFATVYSVSNAELSVLCLLFLRGAQTPGEINTNAGRLYEFASLQEVSDVLNTLSSRVTPFVKELARKSGQKENRFIHLFGDIDESIEASENVASSSSSLEVRVNLLEQELLEVKALLEKITRELF
jgi:uncharacterized protein